VARLAGPGDGRRCGVDGAVLSRLGQTRCQLCFGDFLRGWPSGRQLDAKALLGEVRPETHGLTAQVACTVVLRRRARAAAERREKSV
jgi:hypothetical protein